MEYTKKKQRPVHKGSTTYYGKTFLQGKKYDEVGKYYPNKGEMVSIDSRSKFQTTDSLFYTNPTQKFNKNLHYTTTTNFTNRRPYDNGPFTAHRIKEATPECDEDVFELFDDQKVINTPKPENELMSNFRQTKYKQRPNSSRVTKRSHLNTANGKREKLDCNKQNEVLKTSQNEVGIDNHEQYQYDATCSNGLLESDICKGDILVGANKIWNKIFIL